jgi:hypothetical protein
MLDTFHIPAIMLLGFVKNRKAAFADAAIFVKPIGQVAGAWQKTNIAMKIIVKQGGG